MVEIIKGDWMKIGNTGAWQNNSLEGHIFDQVLASSIVNFLKQKN